MSEIRVDNIKGENGKTSPEFPNGTTITGIITARDGIEVSGIVTARPGFAVTYYGDGSNLTGIDATQIQTGNTSVQTIDTGSDGHVKITTEGTERVRVGAAGSVGIGTDDPKCELDVEGTGSIQLPVGSDSARPTASADYNGMLRYNSDNNEFEGIINGAWSSLSSSASSASLDVVAVGSITGTPGISETLSVSNPTVIGGDTNYSFTYQWQVAASGSSTFSAISGATSSTLVVANTYNSVTAVGQQIRCLVTATDGGGKTSAAVISNVVTIAITRQATTWRAGRLFRLTPDSATGAVSSMTETQITVNSSTTTKVVSWWAGLPYTLGAVTDTGEVWTTTTSQSTATDLPDRQSYFERSGRTVIHCVAPNGAGNYVYILYDNGSIYYTNGSTSAITELHSDSAAATNPCKTFFGCMYYSSSSGGAIFENGQMMLFLGRSGTDTINGATAHTLFNPLPAGVKCVDAAATGTIEANPNRRTMAMIILGDDGYVYSAGDNTYAIPTVTAGSITEGGAAKDTTSFGDVIAIGGNQGNDNSWAGGSYAGDKSAWILRSNGSLWFVGDGDSAWKQLGSDTDYLTVLFGNLDNNIAGISTVANTIKWGHHDLDAGDVVLSSSNRPSDWQSAFSKLGPTSFYNGFGNTVLIIPD